MSELLQDIDNVLVDKGASEAACLEIIDLLLAHFGCVLGTVHVLDPESKLLRMRAHRNMPPVLMDKVSQIPIGKGMAGLAAQRREAVQVCNLQTDDSGVAKPGAKLTGMEGSISFPMLVEGEVVGTMGIAKPTVAEFSADEISLLMQVAEIVGNHVNKETHVV